MSDIEKLKEDVSKDKKFLSRVNKTVTWTGVFTIILGIVMLLCGFFIPPPGVIDRTTAYCGGFCIIMGAVMHFILPLATHGMYLKFHEFEIKLKSFEDNGE